MQQIFQVKNIPKTTTNKQKIAISNGKAAMFQTNGKFVQSNKNSARADTYNMTDQNNSRNTRYQNGGQFRNSKSLKKATHGALVSNMQSTNLNLQQQYASLQQLQRPELFNNQYSSVQSLKPANMGEQTQPLSFLHQIDMRQSSLESMKSQGSLESAKDAILQDQHRRRLIALAQAQQQQIIATATTNRQLHINQTQMNNIELSRNKSDANIINDIQVISKKLVSFRSHSKSGEKKGKIEFKNSRNKNIDNKNIGIKVKMNKTQPFNIQNKPVAKDTNLPITHREQQPTLMLADQQKVFGQSQALSNLHQFSSNIHNQGDAGSYGSKTEQQSPRKQSNNGQIPIGISSQEIGQQAFNQRPLLPNGRVASSNPQRRLHPAQTGSKKQNTAYSGEHTQMSQAANGPQPNYSRRRNVPQQTADAEALSKPMDIPKIQLSQNATQRSNYGSLGSGITPKVHQSLHGANKLQAQSQNSLQLLQNNRIESGKKRTDPAAQFQTEPDQRLSNQPVIIHPHPLNKNMGEFNTIQHQAQFKVNQNSLPSLPIPSENNIQGPGSQRQQNVGVMNNRNSRQNLKPLSKKKPSYKINQNSQNQFNINVQKPPSQGNQNLVPNLQLAQSNNKSISGSRDRPNGMLHNQQTGVHLSSGQIMSAKAQAMFKNQMNKVSNNGELVSARQIKQSVLKKNQSGLWNEAQTEFNLLSITEQLDQKASLFDSSIQKVIPGTGFDETEESQAHGNSQIAGMEGLTGISAISTIDKNDVSRSELQKDQPVPQSLHTGLLNTFERANGGDEDGAAQDPDVTSDSKSKTNLAPSLRIGKSQPQLSTVKAYPQLQAQNESKGDPTLKSGTNQQQHSGASSSKAAKRNSTSKRNKGPENVLQNHVQPSNDYNLIENGQIAAGAVSSQISSEEIKFNHQLKLKINTKQDPCKPIDPLVMEASQKTTQRSNIGQAKKDTLEEHGDVVRQGSQAKIAAANQVEGHNNAKASPVKIGYELNEIREEGQNQELGDSNIQQEENMTQVNKSIEKFKKDAKMMNVVNKMAEQRTTIDTNSNRKVNTDSQQRTNFNTSMQNIPRGMMMHTGFSLNSVVSREERPPLPLNAQKVLKYYISELTDYEKGEVLEFEKIYFLGKTRSIKVDQKKQTKEAKVDESPVKSDSGDSSPGTKKQKKEKVYNHNYGYDDEDGDYKIVNGDHVGYRYEIVQFLGQGSFGTALKCIDHKEKELVAIKIVKNKKKYYYQASVELKILQYLQQQDQDDIMNVIHIKDYVIFRKHLCMSFELLSMNLFEFLKINDFNGFDHNLVRRFAIQLLYALKYLRQLEIIHCDLKPENILLKEENKSGIKIIDFGSSTFSDEKVYTYIQSRFYRAPEIMLGIPYTTGIDMWSLGCIMAELYIGYPIFPGESENDQMSRIMEMRDCPPEKVLNTSERKMKFFNKNKDTGKMEPIMLKNSRGKLRKPNGKPLAYVIGDEDLDFTDFVEKCLDWNPETRITPDEALKHIWVLKGLPPQVLIHHQKMHNIQTPELPESVKVIRDKFLEEQRREQMLLQHKEKQLKKQDGRRDVSNNPDVKRPAIQLKTPRAAQANQFPKNNMNNANAYKPSGDPSSTKNPNSQGLLSTDSKQLKSQPGSLNATVVSTSQINVKQKIIEGSAEREKGVAKGAGVGQPSLNLKKINIRK